MSDLVTFRKHAAGPGIRPEQALEIARRIAIEEGARPGDDTATAMVLARALANSMRGGFDRLPPLTGKAELNADGEKAVD